VGRLALRPHGTDKAEFALLWGDLDRRLVLKKSARRLASWWVRQFTDLPRNWPVTLVHLIHKSALELQTFRLHRSEDWGRSYLKALRTRRASIKKIAAQVKKSVLLISKFCDGLVVDQRGLDCRYDPALLVAFSRIATNFAETFELEAKSIKLVGHASVSAKGAERGRLIRRLGDHLARVPSPIRNSFIADVISLLGLPTSTQNAHSILRQKARIQPRSE
jgi:hypothetical protein